MTTRIRRSVIAALLALGVVVASPAGAHAAGCSEAASRAASQTYLDALIDPNAAWSIPLTPNVIRYENGIPTSFSAFDLRLQLFLHLQYSVFSSIEDVVWTWNPDGRADVINATYYLPVGLPGLTIAGSTVDEDFTLTADCRIRRIDATFTVEQPR